MLCILHYTQGGRPFLGSCFSLLFYNSKIYACSTQVRQAYLFFQTNYLSHCFGMQFILKLYAMNLLLFYFIIQGGSTDSIFIYF